MHHQQDQQQEDLCDVQSRVLRPGAGGEKYSEAPGLASNMPSIQFVHGSSETLQMELFFDTYYAASMVGGSVGDVLKLNATALAPAPAKMDVRKYTAKIYDLMIIDKSTHVPPLLKIEWGSLQFEGHLVNCSQKFTMFNQLGTPVRATLQVTFKQYMKPSKIAEMKPNESPDTAKYRTIHQGDALWSFSGREYGQCEQWRVIANANQIEKPRSSGYRQHDQAAGPEVRMRCRRDSGNGYRVLSV